MSLVASAWRGVGKRQQAAELQGVAAELPTGRAKGSPALALASAPVEAWEPCSPSRQREGKAESTGAPASRS